MKDFLFLVTLLIITIIVSCAVPNDPDEFAILDGKSTIVQDDDEPSPESTQPMHCDCY